MVIEVGDGKYEFLREDFRSIVPGFTPEAEWDARHRQSLSGGFTARYESAWWAITNGLGKEAASELRALHGIDPKHAPTARMTATLDRSNGRGRTLSLTASARPWESRPALPAGRMSCLLHQQSEAEAEERRCTAGASDHAAITCFSRPRESS